MRGIQLRCGIVYYVKEYTRVDIITNIYNNNNIYIRIRLKIKNKAIPSRSCSISLLRIAIE